MESSSVSIKIGGTLKSSDIRLLAESAERDGAGTNYEFFTDLTDIVQHIKAAAAEKRPLCFSAAEVSWGEFTDIEAACRDSLGLTYCRHSEPNGSEWGNLIEFWEPARDYPATYTSNNECCPMLSAKEIIQLRDEGKLDETLAAMQRIADFDFPRRIVRPTLEEFIDTKVWCEDLGIALSDARWGEAKGVGYLYVDTLYIERCPPLSQHEYQMPLDGDTHFGSLPDLERLLYDFATSNGFIEGETP